MIGLRTARALVIDDDENEAIPIIKALSRLGIGAIYLTGDKIEELPDNPFRGIRIAFVDMKLNVEGSAKQVVGKTINVLEHVLIPDESPCIIIVWTKHNEYFDEFTKTLGSVLPELQPGVIRQMEKPTTFDIDKITTEISSYLNSLWPLGVMLSWEQLAHDAASGTTETISKVVAQEAALTTGGTSVQRWQRSVKAVLAALVRAGGGQIVERDEAIGAMLQCLSALHLDQLENEERELCDENASKLLWDNVRVLSSAGKVSLNSRLLTSGVNDNDMLVRPGNLYLACPDKKKRCPVTRFGLTAEVISNDIRPSWTKDSAYRELDKSRKQLEKKGADKKSIQEKQGEVDKRAHTIISECAAVVLELSPICDFMQGKQQVARFIGGLIVPDDYGKVFAVDPRRRTYLKQLQGISIPGRDGTWHLILNARFCYGVRNLGRTIRVAPSCRLRAPVVTDIQSWFAAHAARPGYVAVN